MIRRHFLTGLGSAALSYLTPAQAAGEFDSGPIQKVGPFPGERMQVFEFFQFTCFFCQQHHEGIASWGRSIPAPVRFEPVPVVSDFDSFKAARAFYAVKHVAPDKLDAYMRAAFDGARRGVTDFFSPALFSAAGVSQKAIEQAWRSASVKEAIQRAAELGIRYRVTATPSLAVGGTHLLHADQVNGDYGAMMRLASGLVSRVLEGSNA